MCTVRKEVSLMFSCIAPRVFGGLTGKSDHTSYSSAIKHLK